ncbi:hypothetical protein GCM10023144_30660 [Pigmentiphaga soli]|uniref:Type II secretion system protein GspF domain-containing protein n=1 Tax=Pigmentiphaga soli TaxID=1007095 RepID=A0ABP8H9U4_9BURK
MAPPTEMPSAAMLAVPWLAAVAAAIGAAAAAAWLHAWLAHSAPPALLQRRPLPYRVWGRLAAAAGRAASGWLSPRRRRAIERGLGRAGLRHELDAVHYHGMQCMAGTLLAAAGVALAAAAGASPMAMAGTGLAGAASGAALPACWLRERVRERNRRIVRALPFMLDMATLCVEAGLGLPAALQQAAAKGPAGPLRDELMRLHGDVRAGLPRTQALRDLADRVDEPALRALVHALVQADTLGMNLAPLLRAQSDQRRTERFLQAEKLALEAPVKMLLPLIACIFPCTFVVIAFPIAVRLLELAG